MSIVREGWLEKKASGVRDISRFHFGLSGAWGRRYFMLIQSHDGILPSVLT